jgi:class 3 adenylate cyclase
MADTIVENPATNSPKKGGIRLGLRVRFTLMLGAFILAIMVTVMLMIRQQQQAALDKEVRERGLALSRALAANSVEPLALGSEATLQIMLLVKDVIQTSDDAEQGRKQLYLAEGFWGLVFSNLGRLGRDTVLTGLRNEGVLYAEVVDPTGRTIAYADTLKPAEAWLDEIDKPYQPPPNSGLLSPGESEKTWDSPVNNGIYIMAVPIVQRGPGTGSAEAVQGAPAPAAESGGKFMGSVYLGMSKAIVRRALALAVSRLLLTAAGILVFGVIMAMLIAGLLVKPIHILRDGVLAVGAGKLDTQVSIVRGDELGDLASAFNRMAKGLAERELIRGAFGAYVSHDVLDDILKNPDAMKVGGARRVISRIFTDVRGFTSMSEKLEPEAVVQVINTYLDVQAKIISAHKGYLERFVGDAVSAVFGVPVEKPDDAERAVRCAWAIREGITKLVEERKRQGLVSPLIGIGVDTGHAVAGNIGAQGVKLDYTVIGDPVAISEVVQDAARDPEGQRSLALITEDTYALVKDIVLVREMPPLKISGREQPVGIFELVGLKDAAAAAPAGPA